MVNKTTIQISSGLKEELEKRKILDSETYEEVIWGIIEDSTPLKDETIKEIEGILADIKSGKARTYSHDEIKKRFGL